MVKHQEAINDLSKLLILYPDDPELENIYYLRGTYYKDFNKNMDGINDFSNVIIINPENLEAYYKRASLYMRVDNNEKAVNDLEIFISEAYDRDNLFEMTIEAKIMLHELRREDTPPEIEIITPVERNVSTLDIKRDLTIIEVYGKLIDQNNILYLKVNGEEVKFEKDEATDEVTFNYSLDLTYFSKLTIDVADVYYNYIIKEYDFRRIEADRPVVHIYNPYCPDGNSLSISSGLDQIVIEGSIEDISKISSITIDSIYGASYNKSEVNPTFFCLVDIANKNSIEFQVEDYYGNITIQKYFLNRGAIVDYDDNPMGTTWAFFIENSSYDNFIALEGPKRDVNKMKSVLESNYKVNNISVKRNLTKEGLDRFFSIELRELVKKHDINSVFIWYAGHGQLIDKVGYWIPTDAKKDDEFSYYSLNSLKSSLEVYTDELTHLLIVSDACESGPTFYEVMRSINNNRSCSIDKDIKAKSNQVLTSANSYELAYDNSHFMEAFYNILNNNQNDCVPIEEVATEVKSVLKSRGLHTPQFGIIPGFKDSNGTFFFIRKNQ
jgi:tetratricopeptide (TPR) repeat protein